MSECQAKIPVLPGFWWICGKPATASHTYRCACGHTRTCATCPEHAPVPGEVGCSQCFDEGHECPMEITEEKIMTPVHDADDARWAPLARSTREALANLGHPVEPTCFPDESAPCGATFERHAVAHLVVIIAAADHHLLHLDADASVMAEIYAQAAASFRSGCIGSVQR